MADDMSEQDGGHKVRSAVPLQCLQMFDSRHL